MKHVKENALAHGEFGAWAREKFGFTPSRASNLIAVYENFGKLPTSANIPAGKLFELIALPVGVDKVEFVSQPHIIPSTGESKTVDEMTVRELREVTQSKLFALTPASRKIFAEFFITDDLQYLHGNFRHV